MGTRSGLSQVSCTWRRLRANRQPPSLMSGSNEDLEITLVVASLPRRSAWKGMSRVLGRERDWPQESGF
jgi:hypothetical protein